MFASACRTAGMAWVAAGCLAGCGQPEVTHFEFAGSAMGTSWHVTVVAPPGDVREDALNEVMAAAIDAVEQSMSTWLEDSDVSRTNNAGPGWHRVPTEFCEFVAAALAISSETGGAFDPTAGALVNLWGFGPGDMRFEPPAEAELDAVRAVSGHDKLEADCSRPALRKAAGGVYVDLSAIAKGYAVDRVADILDARSVSDYLVEIGGELRVRGRNPAGGPWRIAIELPDPGGRGVQRVVEITDTAVATSGDYRNFFEYDGRRYSHTIDPRTGRPIEHDAAAVTVVTLPAARADALATALLVLGPDEGLAFAERADLAALFLLRAGDMFVERASSRFTEEVGLL